MPIVQEHIAKAKHNEEFIVDVPKLSHPFLDWTVVGVFYAALHYVDACLAKRDIHPTSHVLRSGYVARIGEIKAIYPDYRSLEDVSRDARYTDTPITDHHVSNALQTLQKIKSQLLPLLGTS